MEVVCRQLHTLLWQVCVLSWTPFHAHTVAVLSAAGYAWLVLSVQLCEHQSAGTALQWI